MAKIMFISFGGGGASDIVGPANVVYVESPPKGNDATGQRGNAALPFATVAAAMAVMQDGDQMRIAPGFYLCENISPPVGVTRLSIVGSGRGTTGLACSLGGGGNTCLTFGDTISSVTIIGLDLDASGDPSDIPIVVDGTGGGGATLNDGMFIQDCVIRGGTNGITLSSCGRCVMRDCRIRDGSLSASDSRYNIWDTTFENGAGLSISWPNGADAPSRAPNTFSSISGRPDVILSGAPWVTFDDACEIGGVVSAAPLTNPAAGVVPVVEIHGRCVQVDITLPDTADPCTVDFSDMELFQSATVAVTGNAAPQTVRSPGLTLLNPGIGNIVAGDGVVWTADDLVLKSPAPVQTIGTGTFTPYQVNLGGNVLAAGPTVIALGFTASGAPTNVQATATTLAAAPLACTARSATNVTIDSAAGGNGDVLCTW